ncbi:extracellular solute-binding protein [Saccharibacillus sacchari]|uniref:Extracellular solute-binding protein n=1 Tax=Saccharibacillus sacchari TaxID=456493 RepID=A0ACC6PBG2_9BACL
MKRKNHLVLFGVLLLALINLSPSLPETAQTGPRKEPDEEAAALRGGESRQPLREIEVYTMMGTSEFEFLQALNEEYQQRSGAVVNLVNIAPEQAYKTYREAYATGREPDVLMLDGAWVADFASSGRLLPADLYEGGVVAASDSLPISAASVEWNGYRWGVPLDFDPYGVVWNPKRFTATSGELPRNIEEWKTWEENESAVKTIVGFPGGDVRAFAALIALWKGTEEEQSEQSLEEALALADRLRDRTYLNGVSAQSGQLPSGFRTLVESDELPLAVDRLSRLGSEETSTLRLAPIASSFKTAALRCLGIAANSDRSRESSLWIAYITGHETQSSWYQSTGHLPMLRAIYDEPASLSLQRWLPDAQVGRSSADSKKTAAREGSWSRSLERFYEGTLGIEGLSAFFQP